MTFPMPFFSPVVADGAVYVPPITQWGDGGSGVSLSGGGLIATLTNNNTSVRSATTVATGKIMVEVEYTSANTSTWIPLIGVGNASMSLEASPHSSNNAWVLDEEGNKRNGSNDGAYANAYAVGDIVAVILDADTGSIWFGVDGVIAGDPAAGTGAAYTGMTGPFYIVTGHSGVPSGTEEFTINGTGPFVNAVPSGWNVA